MILLFSRTLGVRTQDVRAVGLLALAGAAIGVGLWLTWVVLIAIGVGMGSLLLMPFLLRQPSAAMWWEQSAPVRVVRGDEAAVVLRVSVPAGSTRWVSAVADGSADRVFMPASDGPADLSWPVDTRARGVFDVGPSRLETGDPFGISRRVLATREPSPVLVIPRVHPLDATVNSTLTDGARDGESVGTETFQSLREYVIGDPQKLIHWRSSAKAGTLMVKRMVDTTVPWLMVVLDTHVRAYDRPNSIFEDFDEEAFESAVDMAASWAWSGCGPAQRVLLTTTALSSPSLPSSSPSPSTPMSSASRSHSASPGSGISVEVTARTRDSALDWLALVTTSPSESSGPGRVQALLSRTGISRLVFVTGAHREHSASWVSAWQRHLPVTVVSGLS